MYPVPVWTVIILAAVVFGLSATVILGRLMADGYRIRSDRLRAEFSKCLDELLAGTADVPAVIAQLEMDRGVALDALVQIVSTHRLAVKEKLYPLFHRLGFVEQELRYAKSRRWGRRMLAVSRLGMMHDMAAVPVLLEALRDEMFDVRIAAARSLAQLRAPEAVEPILRSLALHGEYSLKHAADVLLAYGDAVVPQLQAFLNGRKPGTDSPAAAVAATVIGHCRAKNSVPTLVALLGDQDTELRISAARALGLIGGSNAIDALVACTVDPVWQIRSASAQALGQIGDPETISTLEKLLPDPAWWVRFNAAQSLYQLGDAGRELLLNAATTHDDRFARDICHEFLERHDAMCRMEASAR